MFEGGNNLESSFTWLPLLTSISTASLLSSFVSYGLEKSTSSFSTEFSLVISPRLELELFSTFSIVLPSSSLSSLFSSLLKAIFGFSVSIFLSSSGILLSVCCVIGDLLLSLSFFSIVLLFSEFNLKLSIPDVGRHSNSFNLAMACDWNEDAVQF